MDGFQLASGDGFSLGYVGFRSALVEGLLTAPPGVDLNEPGLRELEGNMRAGSSTEFGSFASQAICHLRITA